MDSWGEVLRISPTLTPSHDTSAISALQFDSALNLIWVGDSAGYSRSFASSSSSQATDLLTNPYLRLHFFLSSYTSFKGSPGRAPVKMIRNHREGVFLLLHANINFNLRRGVAKACFNTDTSFLATPSLAPLFTDLQCMSNNGISSSDLVVGSASSLLTFDINKPSVLTQMKHEGGISIIKPCSKLLALGLDNGSLDMFDPISNETTNRFASHNGLLSDMDTQGSYVATCGYSIRPRRYLGAGSDTPSLSNEYFIDPLVTIYDVRMMRPLAPILFPAGAALVRFHPKLPNIIVVSSPRGQIQFVDIYDQSQVYLYQADLTQSEAPSRSSIYGSLLKLQALSHLEISDNGDYVAFSDSHAKLHVWTLDTNTSNDLVSFPVPIEQPDIIHDQIVKHFGPNDDETPLSSVGMPYYMDPLLSNWPTDLKFVKPFTKLPPKIDHDLEVEASRNPPLTPLPYDKSKYGSRYTSKAYNLFNDDAATTATSIVVPGFLSERGNGPSNTANSASKAVPLTSLEAKADGKRQPENASDGIDTESIFQYRVALPISASNAHSSKTNLNKVPNCYSKLQIQYSRFGVRDFDFSYYNRTNGLYCGLENHTDNSYINSLLQLYRFQPLVYRLIVHSLANEWLPTGFDTIYQKQNPQGSSILNELGYLFDMMHKAGSMNVKASNFAQFLNNSAEARGSGLLNANDGMTLNAKDLRSLMLKFNKFLLRQLNRDMSSQFSDPSFGSLFTVEYEVEVKSSSRDCRVYDKQHGTLLTLDLIAPVRPANSKVRLMVNPNGYRGHQHGNQHGGPLLARRNVNLLNYLECTVNQSAVHPCLQIHALSSSAHNLEVQTTVTRLPPVLSININFGDEELRVINGHKKWLTPEFYAINNGQKQKNRFLFKPVLTQFDQEATKYELAGYVCEICHQSELSFGSHNLVSYIKINGSWYLFNDFLVMAIPEDEVFNMSYPWKRPVVLVYHDTDESKLNHSDFGYLNVANFPHLPNLNDSILYRDHFAGPIRESFKREYELLTREEAPAMGSLVAIDAEFVMLYPEELEVHYDGEKKLIKPKHLSLARFSALRGDNGPKQGTAFIDDYIATTDDIYDYLTAFSGIEEGDLDPVRSTKSLVTLQTAYRKLWLLLNLGIVFVGHGLYNDFRCINLQVPSGQIRDTADYFYKSDFKRQLGLKFLAYVLLKEKVQAGNHDSIEDAHTALLLYKKYLELTATGTFDSTLNYIYAEGQQMRFRVPE